MLSLPDEIKNIIKKLQENDFEAYAVGGCVRDLLLEQKPKDWDIATNALPEQIQKIFPDNFYANKFGTVTIKQESPDETLREIEVTTYRIDEKYSDKRHPDVVCFTRNLQEDLARRDFTINAMALAQQSTIVDYFDGQKDLANGLIRAVGDAEKKFNEDALRMLRAVRFVTELSSVKQSFTGLKNQKDKAPAKNLNSRKKRENFLTGFSIEEKTKRAIQKNASWLQAIAKERIRDELEKILMSARPDEGMLLLGDLGLLKFIIPELESGIDVAQNRHHIYSVFEHGIFSLKFAAQKKYSLVVRLAALLHDIAKPQAKKGKGANATFYNHNILGARVAARILERLRFDRQTIERVANLVYNHMFVYDIGAVTAAGVRRLLTRVGQDNINDLIALRVADRLGSGVPKAHPYRLRHFQYMVERVQHDAISVKMLKINGHDIMEILKLEPGPKIGTILDVLLSEVIEKPEKNQKKYLAQRAKELNEIELSQLRQMAKERIEEKKEEDDKIIKDKYWVK